MKIIPVLDILNGVAVHAIKGRRKDYQPLRSVLCKSANPIEIAIAISSLGFDELYIADLDAILKRQPHYPIFEKITDKTGLSIMVDAGITNMKMAEKVLDSNVSKIIVGTETLQNIDFIKNTVDVFGAEEVIVSLDLMGQQILSGFELGKIAGPLQFLHKLENLGITQIIILDLSKVGSGEGINMPFLKKALKNTRSKVFIGGGVRDIDDLKALKETGVYGVLVATALHTGTILSSDLRDIEKSF